LRAGLDGDGHEFQSNRRCRNGGSGAARRRAGANSGRRDVRSDQFVDHRIVACGSRPRCWDETRDGATASHGHALSVGFDAFLLVLAARAANAFAAELSVDAAGLSTRGARWRHHESGFFFRNDLASAGLSAGIANRRRAFGAIPGIRMSSVVKEQLCFLSVFDLAGRFVRASTSEGDLVMHLKSVILGSAAVLAMSTIAVLAQPATTSPPATSPASSSGTPTTDQGTSTQPVGTDAGGATATTTHHHMHHVVHHRMHHAAKASSAEESSEEATTAQLNQQQAANPGSAPSGGMGGSNMGGSNMNSGSSGAPTETPSGNSNTSTPGSDNGTQPPKNSDVPDNSKDNTGNPH
jgi:hypothetical protein